MLRKNGLLVVTTPDCSGWDFPIFGQGLSLLPLDIPRWFFTPGSLRELLKQSGYKVLKVTTFETKYTLPADSSIPHTPKDCVHPRNITDMPSLSQKGTRHLRIFARQDRRGIFSSMWMEEQEFQSSEQLKNLETVLEIAED
jgi:hypothetical protein